MNINAVSFCNIHFSIPVPDHMRGVGYHETSGKRFAFIIFFIIYLLALQRGVFKYFHASTPTHFGTTWGPLLDHFDDHKGDHLGTTRDH